MIVFSTTIYSFEVGLCTVQIILCHTNKYNYLQGKLCTLGCAATKQNHRFKFNNYLNCNKIYACTPAAWKKKSDQFIQNQPWLFDKAIYIYIYTQTIICSLWICWKCTFMRMHSVGQKKNNLKNRGTEKTPSTLTHCQTRLPQRSSLWK